MANRDETRKVEIIMNGQKANASLKEMKASASLLWNQLSKLPPTSKDFVDKSRDFEKIKERINNVQNAARGVSKEISQISKARIIINGQKADASIDEMKQSAKLLYEQLEKLPQGSNEFIKSSERYKTVTKRLETIQKEAKGVESSVADISNSGNKLTSWLKKIGPVIIATFSVTSLMNFAKRVFSVRSEFEKLEAVLTATFKGDKNEARKSMQMISDLASETPFQLKELTEGFVKLANRGIVPTKEEMRQLGDVAANQGKSMDQYIEAVLDAMTGENERLKEFGIKASKHGDKVSYTFKGVTTEVENSEEAIKNYLIGIGKMDGVAGSMAAVSQTLTGKISNLWDSFDQLFNALGEHGSPILSKMIGEFSDLVGMVTDWVKIPTSDKVRQEKDEMNLLVAAIESTNEGTDERKRLIAELQAKYPDFMENLSAEKVTNGELRDRLKEVNAQYEQKILNHLKEEEVTELLKQQIALREKERNYLLAIAKEEEKAANGERVRGASKFNMKKGLQETREEMLALQEEISKLDEKYKELGLSVVETQSIETKTIAKKKEISKEEQKLLDQKLKAERSMQDLRIAMLDDAFAKERAKTWLKYEREIEDLDKNANTYQQHSKLLRQAQWKELADLQAEFDQENEEKRLSKRLEALDKQYELDKQHLNNSKAMYGERLKDFYAAEYELERKRLEDLAMLEEESNGAKTERYGQLMDELAALDQSYFEKLASLREKDKRKMQENIEEGLQKAKEAYEAISSEIMAWSKMKSEKEILSAEKSKDAQIEALEEKKEKGIITTEEYESAKEKIEDTYNDKVTKEKNKMAKAEKKNAIAQAIINGAIATTKALAQLGPIAGAIAATIIAGTTTAQVIRIKKTPLELYEEGGFTSLKKADNGSFKNGGWVKEPKIGIIGEKGAEWVAPNWMLQHPATANVIGMLEAKRQTRAFADGGTTAQVTMPEMGNVDFSSLEALLQTNNRLLQQQNALLGALPASMKVWLSLVELDDGLKMLQKIRDDASVR